jgi:hypothetical protein
MINMEPEFSDKQTKLREGLDNKGIFSLNQTLPEVLNEAKPCRRFN